MICRIERPVEVEPPEGLVIDSFPSGELCRAALVDLINATHAGSSDSQVRGNWARLLVRRLEAGIFGETSPELWLRALYRGQPVGIALGAVKNDVGYIVCLGIQPDWRATGLSTILMSAILDRFKRRGLAAAEVSVDPANLKAIRFYEKYGFTRI